MLSDLLFRVRALLRRRVVETELEAELRGHLEAQIAKHRRAGLTEDEALRRARLEFGGLDQITEACRDARGVGFVEALASDTRYGVRTLMKDRAFSAIAITTLALGIGAATTVFSVVNAILIRPLPYPDAAQILFPWRQAPPGIALGFNEIPWGRSDFLDFSAHTRAFGHLGAFLSGAFNLTGEGDPVRLDGARVSAGFFPTLGVAAQLGRVFTPDDDRIGRERVVMLSDRIWRDRFGGTPAIVGRAVNLNGASYTVVGVMPSGFGFPRAAGMPGSFTFPEETQLWVPLALPPGPTLRGEPSELAVIGRLAPGVPADRAQAELDVFTRDMERRFPRAKGWFNHRVTSIERQLAGDTRRPLVLLLAAVLIVLLIACANVANLLLTRSVLRTQELSLRAALGASRGRLTRQLVTESLLLAGAGGAAGVALAAGGLALVKAFGPANIPRLSEARLDGAVLVFALVLALVTGVGFGLVPALSAAQAGLVQALKEGSARTIGASGRSRLRRALLVSEVALALVLTIASGLLVRTFAHLLRVDSGFNAERVLTFELTLPPATYSATDRIVRLYGGVLQKLQTLPGVQSVGIGETVPMGGAGESTGLRVVSRPQAGDHAQPFANYTIASPGYLSAIGTPLLRGRDFLETDTAASPPVAIVNTAMARKYWPGQDAIGQQVGLPIKSFNMTIIGVVANVKHVSLREEPGPEIYVPYTQDPWPSMLTMHVAVRTKAEPAAVASSVREAIRGIDPTLPVANVATLAGIVDQAVAQPRFSMLLVAGFGVLALLLACVGLYGAMSYAVTSRAREIGIRLALGAAPRTVVAMVLAEGARVTGAGMMIGLAAAIVVLRVMTTFLFGVEPTDPATFALVSAALLCVALLACYVPARRATRVDPMLALRRE
jgi:predicted permease